MSAEPMSPERLAAAREVVASGMPMANERAADLLAEVDRLRSDPPPITIDDLNLINQIGARFDNVATDDDEIELAEGLWEMLRRFEAALSGEHPERNDG